MPGGCYHYQCVLRPCQPCLENLLGVLLEESGAKTSGGVLQELQIPSLGLLGRAWQCLCVGLVGVAAPERRPAPGGR